MAGKVVAIESFISVCRCHSWHRFNKDQERKGLNYTILKSHLQKYPAGWLTCPLSSTISSSFALIFSLHSFFRNAVFVVSGNKVSNPTDRRFAMLTKSTPTFNVFSKARATLHQIS